MRTRPHHGEKCGGVVTSTRQSGCRCMTCPRASGRRASSAGHRTGTDWSRVGAARGPRVQWSAAAC
eukprot:5629033-Prymnesium_polylepis.2